MADLQDDQIKRFQAQLEERVTVLGAEIAVKGAEASPDDEPPNQTVDDLAARGETLTRQAMADAERERDVAELRDIEAALARIRQGSYGECIDCGVGIAPARLEAQPSAARCIDCQSAQEASGGGPRSSAH